MLALTGQIATRFLGRGLGILHELGDAPGMLGPITKKAFFAGRPLAGFLKVGRRPVNSRPLQGPRVRRER